MELEEEEESLKGHFQEDSSDILPAPCQLAIIKHVTRQESRSSAGADHVTLQALITWLIKSRSRD